MTSGAFLGIDIGGTNTKLALVSEAGRLLARDMIETRATDGVRRLFARIGEVLPTVIGPRRSIAGVGIGCAGLVDTRSGTLRSAPNLPGWENTPVSRIGRQVFGVYTYVDNDANAAAYGEYQRGCGRRSRLFVCITLGTGVGGGIVDRGELLRGSRNYAGEIGHMTVSERGPRCKCGNRGCLEAYVGADALVRSARRILGRKPGRILRGSRAATSAPWTPEMIARAARKGDRAAREVFDRAADHLGTAIATLVNVLNPDVVGVAGGVATAFDLIENRVREVVAERAFPESAEAVAIVRGVLGFDAAAIGAALLVRDAVRSSRKRRKGV
jgi:glucokinase